MRTLNSTMASALLAAALAAPLAAPPALAAQAFLNESVVVGGNVVYLGDLFSEAGENAGAAVAYAPAPGKRAVFDARWLYRVARAYHLDWKPLSPQDQAVVERQSFLIKREEVEDHILAALIDKGLDADMRVELSNRMLRIHVPGDSSATLAVEDIMFEPRTQRFTAIIAAPANDPAAKRIRVTGRAYRVREVPVLARRVLAGEIIGENDINWLKIRTKRIQNNTVLDAEALIGMTPSRGALRVGAAVRSSDIRRPVLVAKGSLVTMVLRLPNMILTSQGKAIENGSDGDTIRVTNTQSNTVVEAVVIGANKVTVRPLSHVVMN